MKGVIDVTYCFVKLKLKNYHCLVQYVGNHSDSRVIMLNEEGQVLSLLLTKVNAKQTTFLT